MAILRFEAATREVGTFVILDGVSGAIARGERVGLVGANGAGKTTLLRLAAAIDEPDRGRVQLARGTRIGLLTQESNLDEAFAAQPTLRAAVRSGAQEVERLERELAALEASGAHDVASPRYAELRERFEVLDGYSLDVRVDEALSGLGFDRADWDRPPTQMSGGQQTRAALARLLVSESELLLLDEPTNHLDVAAIEWLEGALGRRDAALLVASHDRAFLDNVVERIWELRDRRLTTFRGSYSAYLVQREDRDARQRLEAERDSERIERERQLVGTFRSHRKYSAMHEHERRLAKLEASASSGPRGGRRLALPADGVVGSRPARSSEISAELRDAVLGFTGASAPGAVVVAEAPRLEARRGDRVGIVGPNGAGKTTLLRTLAGRLPPLSGIVRLGHGVVPGYLAQVRDALPSGTTVLGAILAATPLEEGAARGYLARFLFRGDDVFKAVTDLSGGERSRLELALMGIGGQDLLLLDEPTNHLDIPAREALEAYLRETTATVLLVSHDRRLLETVCSTLWVVEPRDDAPNLVAPFPGTYREWRAAVADGWRPSADGRKREKPEERPAPARPAESPAPTRIRLSKDAYARRKQTIEADLTRLGLRKTQLELALGDPAAQANYVELRRLGSELADVDAALAQAEDAWLVLEEQAPR